MKYKRPLILMGNGARGCEDKIINIAELYNINIQTTWRAMDMIEDSHPLFKGRPGSIAFKEANVTLQECDLLIVIGARLDLNQVGYNYDNFAPKAHRIICDIDSAEREKLEFDFEEYRMTAREYVEDYLDKPL